MGNCFKPPIEPDVNHRRQLIYEVSEFWSFRDECCVCMENPVQTGFMNCGHTVTCLKCAFLLKNNSNFNLRSCPICRTPITNVVTFTPNITVR